MYGEPQTLIVVYKDELVLNLLKKYVESNDDGKDGTVVGTEDGSVDIVAWDEKHWKQQKDAGTIKDKILIIGNVKGAEKLSPIIDVKYNEYGIKYGWAGDQSLLQVDNKALRNKKEYDKFLEEFKKEMLPENNQKNLPGMVLKKSAITFLFGLIGLGASFAVDYYKDQNKVKQQQLLFGVTKLYKNDLESFMKQ